MSREHFSILGLTPARYEPAEIARRFHRRRKRLLSELDDPAKHVAARRQLDDLYRAYNALRDPRRQAEHLRATRDGEDDRVAHLRRFIEASLEGGLLRYSRRIEVLVEGRRLGFSDFHTQLMIAQVQFGDELALPERGGGNRRATPNAAQVGARLAAVGVLALAIFLAMVRWLGN